MGRRGLICFFKRILDWLRGPSNPSPPPSDDPIKHVIVLMFENHSFDQMLGCFRAVFPGEIEGVDPARPGSNKDSTGRDYAQKPSPDPIVSPDPKHELGHILDQIANGNSGFVSEYESEYPETTPEQRQRIMDYFRLGDLPALHALAQHFTICDHWYSSVPGPTWTNRFFVHSGTSKGIVDMPENITQTSLYLEYDQDTIFDRLNEKQVQWRVYMGDIPQSLVLAHQRHARNAFHYRWMNEFWTDVAGPAASFPAYTFIEPAYYHGEQNDDHPPHSTMPAQRLLAQVYNAIRANAGLWNSTLFVVLYDEHGGFYDHVSPPAATPPDAHQQKFAFNRLGVRVPALLVSPWVERAVLSTTFDHTSLLAYLTAKWNLAPLTNRVRDAKHFGDAIRKTGSPRVDTPASLPVPALGVQAPPVAVEARMTEQPPLNENQRALEVFTEHLEQQTVVPAAAPPVVVAEALPDRTRAMAVRAEAVKARVEAFLREKKAEAVALAQVK